MKYADSQVFLTLSDLLNLLRLIISRLSKLCKSIGKAHEVFDSEALRTQIKHRGGEERLDLFFIQALLGCHFPD